MKMSKLGAVAAVAMLAGVTAGSAAEPKGWKFEITPYAWLAGVDGDVTIRGRDAEFERSFGDILDTADMAGGLFGTVQYDRYLLWGQIDYLSASTENLDEADQPVRGSLDMKMTLGELAVGYQIDGWMEGQTFDLLVGVRTLSFDNELTVYGRGTVEREDRENKDDRVDAIFVVRPSIPVFPSKIKGLRFNPTLGIGGGDSDLVFELQPQLQYQINDRLSARLGYRTVGYKLTGDNAQNENLNLTKDDELNVTMSGLIIGLGVTF